MPPAGFEPAIPASDRPLGPARKHHRLCKMLLRETICLLNVAAGLDLTIAADARLIQGTFIAMQLTLNAEGLIQLPNRNSRTNVIQRERKDSERC